MRTLEAVAADPRDGVLASTPLALIAGLAAAWLAVAVLVTAAWLPEALLRIVSITAAHGGLLAVAVAWGAADGGVVPARRIPWIVVGLVGAGATAAALEPRAAVVYLATPIGLAALARRGRLHGLGLGSAVSWRPMLVGAGVGAFLGVHVLYSASRTLEYSWRGGDWTPLLGLWAYDVGASVLSAECFFRGALFNRLQRRWSFAAAAGLATGASLARYLVDPLLPGQIEVLAGALFYMSILGVANCWLLWSSGSLLPGLLSALLFFLAYRLLAIG